MEEKIKKLLKLSSSSSSSSMENGEEEFLYETIEAPKFVDFTRPNHFCPDDRYWFCSRVGCDRKHEQEMDSEAIYKNFVLRVMAARSPNVRLRKALTRKAPSESKKCPLSAPLKPSKSRLPRLALLSSISKKLIDDEKGTTKPLPATKPSSTPKARVKHVSAKYMTSPRKKKGGSPNPNAFRTVRNTKRVSVTIPKNKVVAKKALVFISPKKAPKVKSPEDMATPITKLCEGIKKLEIASQHKGKTGNILKPSKECKSDASKAKARKYGNFSRCVKSKTNETDKKKGEPEPVVHEARTQDDSSDMEIDEKSRTNQKESISSLERPITEGSSSDAVSVNTLTSEMTEMASSDNGVSESENPAAVETPNADEESRERKGSAPEGEVENQNGRVLGELTDNNDDKENAPSSNNIRNLNGGNLNKHDAPLKYKMKKMQTLIVEKNLKENCCAGNKTQGVMKYKKLKPTNPKPFRLRTDERGILKDATLERKANSHENTTVASESSQYTSNAASDDGEKEGKKDVDKRLKINQLRTIKSKYKVEPKSDRGLSSEKSSGWTKSPSLQKQAARPQRGTVTHVKSAGLGAIEETTVTTLKPKESRKRSNVVVNPTNKASVAYKLGSQGRRAATVPREPNFQSLHKPKSCTKIVEQRVPFNV